MIKKTDVTVIICCAGMGTRLGIGTTKALVDVGGEPLIIRQLKLLDAFDDIRVVVGFDAERVINVVKEYRKDIMFVCNYEYEHNGPADSLKKALLGVRKYVIAPFIMVNHWGTIILAEPLELPDDGRRYIDEETDWNYDPFGGAEKNQKPCVTVGEFMNQYLNH